MLRSRPLREPGDASAKPGQSGLRSYVCQLKGHSSIHIGRVHSDLRISVTDRCNFRCVYCMPEEGVAFLPREQILSYEEITSVARVARVLGVSIGSVDRRRAPIRKGVVGLVRQLAELGFDDWR